ncbi:MAG: glycosyltransferase [Desulfuromonadales bacterium]|nr:glycosyltransferase [Desulfuromonadales bacterium]
MSELISTCPHPLVSIVTPVYNAAQYLAAMLESAQAQTWDFYEHLIIDDCSTDNSREIVRHYQQEDSKIKLLSQVANGGPALARNRGINEANGDFIAFLDADDIWMPEKLEHQMAVFRDHPKIGLVGTNWSVIGANGKYLDEKRDKNKRCWGKVGVAEFLLDRIPLVTSSVMVRKKCLEKCGVFNEDYPPCEDFDLWLRIVQQFEVGILEDVLVSYRSHCDGISRNTMKSRISKIKIFENEVLPRIEVLGPRRDEFLLTLQKKYVSLGRMLMTKGLQKDAALYFDKAIKLECQSQIVRMKAHLYSVINRRRL